MDTRSKILENIKRKKLTTRSLCSIMKIKGGKAKALFFSTLKQLIDEKKIYLDEEGFFHADTKKKQKNKNVKKNIIHISNEGYGTIYIERENGTDKFIIDKSDLGGALDGDSVEIIAEDKEVTAGYRKAKVIKILKRSNGKAVFEFDGERLIPHGIYGNIKVICPKEQLKKIVSGSLVLVTLNATAYKKKNEKIIYKGNVERIVGHKDDPDAEMEVIGAKRGFFKTFREDAIIQAKAISQEISEEETKGRVDLREEKIFTIDGSHTKDRDDAISIDIDEYGNYILKVHIADVSHYIKEGSPLDEEARERGTSLYMADSVIPMLPHELSNGICSLNEGVDRLTKTVELKIDKDGNTLSEKIYYSVINSKKAMTYEDINEYLEKGIHIEGYEDFEDELLILNLLSRKEEKNRMERGNIDFNLPDTSVTGTGESIQFREQRQNSAEKIIENCMILANEAIAKHYVENDLPMIKRVHDEPNFDRLKKKLGFLMSEGLCGKDALYLIKKIESKRLNPYDLDNFLRKYKETEVEDIVAIDILTCMSKAIYTNENRGHYGLGLKHYTHFTSPIRRYPDLIVHRLIDTYFQENVSKEQIDEINENLPEICNHSSFMERQADDAEKESLELKMAEYSEAHIGKEYKGKIISFTPYGLDIKLDNNIKGVAKKNDIQINDNKQKNSLRLGQTVYVIIKEVSVPHRAIYLSLIATNKTRNKEKKI